MARADRSGPGRAGQGHEFDLVFMFVRRPNTQDKFACGYRPPRGRGSDHVRAEYQLRLRGVDGT